MVARRKEVSRAALLTIWIGDALDREAALMARRQPEKNRVEGDLLSPLTQRLRALTREHGADGWQIVWNGPQDFSVTSARTARRGSGRPAGFPLRPRRASGFMTS